MTVKQSKALAAEARRIGAAAADRTRQLEATAREQFVNAEAATDSRLLALIRSKWSLPALIAIAITLFAAGVVIGRLSA